MWDALALFFGLSIGYLASQIEYAWLVRQNWSVSLWKEWLVILTISVLLYFFGVFYPLFSLVHNKVLYNPQIKVVSARQELKRRGSWPLAYSKGVHNRYKPKD
ncbi:hypothetical protein SteCoe_33013 [Stentor coeruleus]|uniref:Uncharacterized protein n=1 Tax=Stentor coeruleus TaxID=5963 RepID=A0A1R2AXS5_9CILI|nr:hypothetical protein SteCoe_33013 [Stentor coeruleus]